MSQSGVTDTDPATDPEIQVADIEATNDFVRFVAPPPRKFVSGFLARWRVARGENLFRDIGCASCHVPSMKTGSGGVPALSNQSVNLYSDLLLHDMGPELADICLGRAMPGEFRTELLMGLRFREHFMHDGNAKSINDAIERHGGVASRVRDAFRGLKEKDKKALLEFLGTI